MSDKDDLSYILATARELFGRAVWTHKVHEVERELCTRRLTILNCANIAIAGATTVFAVLSASIHAPKALILTAVLAAITVCFAIAQTTFDPATKESQQRVAAKEMLWLREQLFLLIVDCHLSTTPIEKLQQHLESIARELTLAYKFMPNTSEKANKITGKRLHNGEMTFSEAEIDSFLPPRFRSGYEPPAPPSSSA
jgi:hypothetical protein